MAKATIKESSPKRRPAIHPDARTNQLISYAIDLVEKRLLDGSASSQETTHFLKQATAKYRLEQTILERQAELITAKTDEIRTKQKNEELMVAAMNAMRSYQGLGSDEDYDY